MARATAAMERIVAAGRKFRARGPPRGRQGPLGPLGAGQMLGKCGKLRSSTKKNMENPWW